MKTYVIVTIFFWFSALACGFVIVEAATGNRRRLWLALVVVLAFAGGACGMLKTILEHPVQAIQMLTGS